MFFNIFSKNNINYSQSYFWLYILNKINIDPASTFKNVDPTLFYNYIFSIFTLSVIALISLFSLIYILLSIYLINTYNIAEKFVKYPKIVKLIYFSKKVNTFWIVLDFLLILFALSIIVITSFLILGIPF